MTRRDPLPLSRVIDNDEMLREWNSRRLREERLLRSIRRSLPRPVAERVSVASGESPSLELSTSSGAIASVVRQHAPRILAALARDGWKFSLIKCRVQPFFMPMSSYKNVSRQWDSSCGRPLVALQRQLTPGPLKTALMRFLAKR
ncbi:MAG TPA: DciA family protein [Casimicrobiaceae bacterium]|nr:DciA family protein [Casimicrobiaceae bacterium]